MDTRAQALAKRLKETMKARPGATLCAAESLTCGRVQAVIGTVSGASDYFLGGITAYTVPKKIALLGVDEREAVPVNGVSEEVARELARGVCRLFDATYSVATTGFAECATPDEVPYAWWAAHFSNKSGGVTKTGRVEFPGRSRLEVQQAVAEAAVEGLLELLKDLPADS